MTLTVAVHRASARMPPRLGFELASHLRKTAISLPSNIAEGHARRSTKEYLRAISIALGSLAELETQLELARSLELLSEETHRTLAGLSDALGKGLRNLQHALDRKVQ